MTLKPCPSCGRIHYKWTRQCAKFDLKPICGTCCQACEYYDSDVMAVTCRYYIYHPKIDYDGEIEKLSRQIHYKMQQIDYFYQKSMTRVAQRIELEVTNLRREKRELEHKKRVTENGNP